MPGITITSRSVVGPTPQGGYTQTFTFSVSNDSGQSAALPAVVAVAPAAHLLEDAAWQQVAQTLDQLSHIAAHDGQGGNMNQIEHVVVLMLENRSLDHALGWLYEGSQPAVSLPAANIPANQQGLPPYVGLAGLNLNTLANNLVEPTDDDEVLTVLAAIPPRRGARSPTTPNHNPGEYYQHILAHLFDQPYEALNDLDPRRITQTGYVNDYYAHHFRGTGITPHVLSHVSEIMDTYLPEQLPVLNGLARHYAVSDQWFCSVPSQTNTNRAFMVAGTARGMVKNGFYGSSKWAQWWNSDSLPAATRTMFDVLEENGKGDSWMYFWHDSWPPTMMGENQYLRIMFPRLQATKYDARFARFTSFIDLAVAGQLPAISIIEPEFGGGESLDATVQKNTNDYHPVSDTTKAEDFVLMVYKALTAKPEKWAKTLFLITFDENGGTYDHVPPPPAQPSLEDKVPDGFQQKDVDATTRTQFGFKFDLYGVRVPTIAISPWIAKSTVFRSPTQVPYDHTSVIATILGWQGIPRDRWNLGARTAAAPSFDQVVSLNAPRAPADPAVGVVFGTPPVRDPHAVALTYGAPFKLRFLGNPWAYPRDPDGGGVPEAPLYITPATQSTRVNQFYPALGGADRAVRLTFEGKTAGQPVLNDDMLRIVTLEQQVGAYKYLGAWRAHFLYYYTMIDGSPNLEWNLRLPSYRKSGAPIYFGDKVIFLSKKFEYQRLTSDLKEPDYLTTRLGTWAFWEIVAP